MGLTEAVANLATTFIGAVGYVGVFVLMVAESMVLPVPSEAVMPFAGFLVADGRLSGPLVVVAATLGSITGSLLSYSIGRYGGRPFLARFGRYLLLDSRDLELTDAFFARRGVAAIFVGRLIPIVRHLISLPAGMARMRLLPFAALTLAGASLWNAFLTWCGTVLGRNWSTVMRYSHVADIVVVAALLLLVGAFVFRHLARKRRTGRTERGES